MSAKKNDRCAVRFEVHGVKVDWPKEGRQKDEWTRPVISQKWKSGSDVKLKL